MTMVDVATIAGLFAGPVAAVLVTLAVEGRRRRDERRSEVIRMLLIARLTPSDPRYQTAINLAPIEFAGSERVLTALADHRAAADEPRPLNQEAADAHEKRIEDRLSDIIKAMLLAQGYSAKHAADVARKGFITTGYKTRDEVLQAAYRALPEIAGATSRSADATAILAARAIAEGP